MRLIFFSLLFIVLGYFTWNQWGVPWYLSVDHQSVQAFDSKGVINSLVLLSEQPELAVSVGGLVVPTPVVEMSEPAALVLTPAKTPAVVLVKPSRLQDVQSTPAIKPVVAEPPVAMMICREFGPFSGVAEAARFRDVVGVGGDVFERQVKKASAQWLVLMPAAGGAVATSELEIFLGQQGLFMSRTGLQGESAIGPFVSEEVALSYQQRLQEIGVVTRLHSADESEKEFWLRSEFQTERLPVVSAAYNGYLSGSQEQGIAQLVCN